MATLLEQRQVADVDRRSPILLPGGIKLPRVKVIRTHYRGITYRSRTEARWAVFFQHLGIDAQYEPEGYVLDGTPYLPDFLIAGWPLFIEVKGDAPKPKERRLARALAAATGINVLLVVGPPERLFGVLYQPGTEPNREPIAFFSRCRRCPALVLSLTFGLGDAGGDGDGYGQIPLTAPCGRPTTCDRVSERGYDLDAAINASRDEKFPGHARELA